MIVGVPSEIKDDEYRVGMLPVGAEELTAAGHTVLIESGAGPGSGISDDDYGRPARRSSPEAGRDLVAGRPGRQGQGAAADRVAADCGRARSSSPTSTSPPTSR